MNVDVTPGIAPADLDAFEQSCRDGGAIAVQHVLDPASGTYTVTATYPGAQAAAAAAPEEPGA